MSNQDFVSALISNVTRWKDESLRISDAAKSYTHDEISFRKLVDRARLLNQLILAGELILNEMKENQ